jgi:putative DNA primase/helicase
VDMETTKLQPHDPKYMSRIQLSVGFHQEAKCPRWMQYLEEVFPEAEEKAQTLQRFYGYCLLPDCRFQRCLFMIGGGANGKSVAVDVLVEVLGAENVCSLPLQLMGERFLIGVLKDKLVNVATEMATNQPIQTANFKDAVAGGLLMADRKHGQPFSFYPIAKHIFSMNDVPKITDKSYGFQRRPIVLTFNETFEGDRADRQLMNKLREETPGIFTWMFEGLAKVLDEGDLLVPESVERDTAEFVKSTNPVLLFVDDCCVFGDECKVKPKALYEEYKKWCEEGKNRPLARNRFYDQVLIHFPGVTKRMIGEKRERVYVGMGLRVPDGF